MSFFDTYTDIGGEGGSWISADEKKVMMDEGIPFQITKIADDDENRYGPRFVAFCLVPDPETGDEAERKIGFPKVTEDGGVESRDRMLIQMQAYLESDDAEPVLVKLEKVGRAILIRQA